MRIRSAYSGIRRRLRRLAAAVRSRSAGASAPAAGPCSIEITLDGASVLNWRSVGCELDGIVLVTDHPDIDDVFSRRSPDEGPPHGALPLADLSAPDYRVEGCIDGSRHRVAAPATPCVTGTRNSALQPDGSIWELRNGEDGELSLVRSAEGRARPGILSIRALHGMVMVSIAPASPDSILRLERRRSRDSVDVLPTRVTEGTAFFRIGAAQWRRIAPMVAGLPDSTSIWNAYLVEPDAIDDGRVAAKSRLRWSGSEICDPRSALRFRRTTSTMVPGVRMGARPYWTADQYLALDVVTIPTTEGVSR